MMLKPTILLLLLTSLISSCGSDGNKRIAAPVKDMNPHGVADTSPANETLPTENYLLGLHHFLLKKNLLNNLTKNFISKKLLWNLLRSSIASI